MKVEKIDLVWAVVSMFIVGISFRKQMLIQGLLLIYALMVVLFIYHIFMIKKRLSGSIAVYGTVMEYHKSNVPKKKGYYPVVKYETETGREITSVYTVEDRQMRYEIGDEPMICYDPDNPMFFYFSDREDDLVKDYYRFIVFGGVIAVTLLFILMARK